MQTEQKNRIVRNRLRIFSFTLLVIVALCLCGHQMSTAQKHSNKGNASVAPAAVPLLPTPSTQEDEVIDGSKNPEKIPDHVAYGMVFRVVGDRTDESEKQKVRPYINQLGLGAQKCVSCGKDAKDDLPDLETDALFATARAYNRQVNTLDMQAKAIRDATWNNRTAEAKAQLAQLQRKKEQLIKTLVASLHKQLGPAATARLEEQINVRVKNRIQIRKKVTEP